MAWIKATYSSKIVSCTKVQVSTFSGAGVVTMSDNWMIALLMVGN